MTDRYPPIEPYQTGMLDTGDGHHVYWECCGNPQGKPALYLHGGPGSGATPGSRRYFDPDTYRIVILDQRGCGRSRPLASEPETDLGLQTTQHLIADIEQLRELLGIKSWVVLGISWGATLAQAYAHLHPNRVDALVLGLVTTTSKQEVDWITIDCGRIFPQQWERFMEAIPAPLRHLPPVDAYAEMLANPDPAMQEHAAREWCLWEDAHVSLAPGFQPSERYNDPVFRLRFARLVTHYWRNHAFLGEDYLLRNAARLNGIPGIMIHGRYDVSGPLAIPWQLAKSWKTAELQILEDAGHGHGIGFPEAVTAALNQLR